MEDPLNDFFSRLHRGGDGVFYSKEEDDSISYPSDGNDAYFQIEESSFWFSHRNQCIQTVVRKFPPTGRGPIFDVGGGNGFVAKGLLDAGWEVVLVEPMRSGARNARTRGIGSVICGTTFDKCFQPRSLPAIGLFDVVEHIEDDLSFLDHLQKLLIPGGMLYMTVPAYRFLWSKEDVDALHYRRYTLSEINRKLANAGMKTQYSTYFFSLLPPAIFLFRVLPFRLGLLMEKPSRKNPQDDHVVRSRHLANVLNAECEIELKLIESGRSMPFGGSCLVAARKE